MELLLTLISSLAGYTTFHFTSHPNSRLHKKIPTVKLKNVQFLPSIRITVRGKTFQLNHWMHFTILLCVSIFMPSAFLDSWYTRGFMLGGLVQGLRYSDRGLVKKVSE
jgi:hypothetical protein